jgi:alpha-D-ribose 1-methylphosphonate 5-triphosphate diphosphatase
MRIFSQRVVTPDSCCAAEVVLDGETIAAVEPRATASAAAHDWDGDLLIPGLIDIHTDNLEKHYQPRPGTTWDTTGAVLAHDAQCATAGITTVFDSLSVHGMHDLLDRQTNFPVLVAAIEDADAADLLRADHLLHMRCEVTFPHLQDCLAQQQDNPRLQMLSLMDHRPGQRQLANRTRAGGADFEIPEVDEALCTANRTAAAELALRRGITLAGHDDATPGHIAAAQALGCTMAEFPVHADAARAAREAGMSIVMGAPNFVRGRSHSGNLSARAAAEHGLLDILASDYIPLSMLRAAFMLVEEPFGWSLSRALATVTSNPARATGLDDRGRIAPGLRADLVRVAWQPADWPRVRDVIVGGTRVA